MVDGPAPGHSGMQRSSTPRLQEQMQVQPRTCRQCGNSGKDFAGQTCACPWGEQLRKEVARQQNSQVQLQHDPRGRTPPPEHLQVHHGPPQLTERAHPCAQQLLHAHLQSHHQHVQQVASQSNQQVRPLVKQHPQPGVQQQPPQQSHQHSHPSVQQHVQIEQVHQLQPRSQHCTPRMHSLLQQQSMQHGSQPDQLMQRVQQVQQVQPEFDSSQEIATARLPDLAGGTPRTSRLLQRRQEQASQQQVAQSVRQQEIANCVRQQELQHQHQQQQNQQHQQQHQEHQQQQHQQQQHQQQQHQQQQHQQQQQKQPQQDFGHQQQQQQLELLQQRLPQNGYHYAEESEYARSDVLTQVSETEAYESPPSPFTMAMMGQELISEISISPMSRKRSMLPHSKSSMSPRKEMAKVRQCEAEHDAETWLKSAVECEDTEVLRDAIPRAAKAGVRLDILDWAFSKRLALEEEAWKQRVHQTFSQELQLSLEGDVVESLTKALNFAVEAGAQGPSLEIAQEELRRRQERQDAERELYIALQSCMQGAGIPALEQAFHRASAANVCSSLLTHARGKLTSIEKSLQRQQAMLHAEQSLQHFLENCNEAAALADALESAREAGVRIALLNNAWKRKVELESSTWQAQKCLLASNRLSSASHGNSVEDLQVAIADASPLGVDSHLLRAACERKSLLTKQAVIQSSSSNVAEVEASSSSSLARVNSNQSDMAGTARPISRAALQQATSTSETIPIFTQNLTLENTGQASPAVSTSETVIFGTQNAAAHAFTDLPNIVEMSMPDQSSCFENSTPMPATSPNTNETTMTTNASMSMGTRRAASEKQPPTSLTSDDMRETAISAEEGALAESCATTPVRSRRGDDESEENGHTARRQTYPLEADSAPCVRQSVPDVRREVQRAPRSNWTPSRRAENLPIYGLDAELEAKAQSKYDLAGEQEAAQWIQDITGVQVVGDFADSLRTGQVLCQLLNCIIPGTISKINNAGTPFKERENISKFLKGCRALGVQEYALFSTDDLYDEKNLNSVVRCIHALGGALRRSVPDFQGPHLGVADNSNARRDIKRDLGVASQTAGLNVTMERSNLDLVSNQIVRNPNKGGC